MIQIKHKVAYYAFNFMSGRHYMLVCKTDFSKTSEYTTKKKKKKKKEKKHQPAKIFHLDRRG